MTTYMKLQEELADARHAYIDMKERALAAEAALAERDKPCVWKDENEYWETNCGESFFFYDGTPVENKYKFCSYCGHPIEVAE